MNKRKFIDVVRQYRAQAERKRKSYAPQVRQAQELYLTACLESGMETAEMAKEGEWSESFIQREYASVDPEARSIPTS